MEVCAFFLFLFLEERCLLLRRGLAVRDDEYNYYD